MIPFPTDKHLMTPLGEAGADLLLIPDSPDDHVEYQCWIMETGEVWWFPQPLVRQIQSMSRPDRSAPSPIKLSDDLFETYRKHILRHKKSPFYDQAFE